MPIYEYRCRPCGKVSSFFTRSSTSPLEPVCSRCKSRDVARRMSSFAMAKNAQSVHEQYPRGSGTPPLEYYSDPRNIGRNVEESYNRHGLDMPQTVRETIDAAREGELPQGVDP